MQQLRLSLLLICLFSLAGGCVASSSHGVVVPKIVWSSGKQQPAREAAAVKQYPSGKEIAAVCIEAYDIEDDENIDGHSFRKSKLPVRYDLTGTHHSITRNSLRCCRLTVVSMLGHSAPRYIIQQVFRV